MNEPTERFTCRFCKLPLLGGSSSPVVVGKDGNEHMTREGCIAGLREVNALLDSALTRLRERSKFDAPLIAQRDQLLEAIPARDEHGDPSITAALSWIKDRA